MTTIDRYGKTQPASRQRSLLARHSSGRLLALKVLTIASFLPEETSFYIFGLRLTFARLLLIALTPFLVRAFVNRVQTRRYRFIFSDFWVLLMAFWMIYAPASVDGSTAALNHAGPIVLEFCVAYLATRFLLSEHGEATQVVNILCCSIGVSALGALLDPLSGHYFIHDVVGAITGYHRNAMTDDIYRMGLVRADGPLEHPILFGFICGIGLLLVASVPARLRLPLRVACGLGAIFAFSSAPLQAIVMGLSLVVYDRAMRHVSARWVIIKCVSAFGILTLMLVSDAPFSFLIRHLLFDPSSGYYRLYSWTVTGAAIELSPWTGLGFGPYDNYLDLTPSADSVWLVSALNYGIPGAILLALAMVGATSVRVSGRGIYLNRDESKIGTMLSIVIFLTLFIGFT